MALLSVYVAFAPISGFLALAISTYFLMGSARGVGGIAMNTNLMEMVPKHLMGRVQNTFYFFGTFLQLVLAICVGAVAQKVSLVLAFAILACVYALSFVAASWPVPTTEAVNEVSAADCGAVVRPTFGPASSSQGELMRMDHRGANAVCIRLILVAGLLIAGVTVPRAAAQLSPLAYVPRPDHAEVEAGAAVRYEQPGHLWLAEP